MKVDGPKILSVEEMRAERDRLVAAGKELVFTNGCFDILHRGHVTYLGFARNQGDALVVGLNSDASVKRNKGDNRPINSEDDRAYVIGSLIGRHKMIPRISPGKTWEGFAGAILTSLVISIGLTRLMGGRVPALTFADSIILGLLLPLVSVVGDLAESVVKRDASIKDSGHTIPGIGGALDLIDSILFTAPVLYFYLQFTGPPQP